MTEPTLTDEHKAQLHLSLAWHCLARNRLDLCQQHVDTATRLLAQAVRSTVA